MRPFFKKSIGKHSEVIQSAREGNYAATTQLRKHHDCVVWTQREVDAVNYLLNNKKAFLSVMEQQARTCHKGTILAPVDGILVDVNVIWTAPFTHEYVILCGTIVETDAIQHWMLTTHNTRVLFHIQPWLTFNIPEGGENGKRGVK